MKRILAFCIFILCVNSAGFAQDNQTGSITITTYYPSPFGAYKNLQLYPSEQPDVTGDPADWAGVMYYNESEGAPYIYNYNGTSGRWERIGSGGPTNYIFKISPDKCSGQLSQAPFTDQLCSEPWHMNISFAEPFINAPHIMVFLERPSDWNLTPCANLTSDQFIAYPELIDKNGFRLTAAGSPDNNSPSEPTGNCKDATHDYQDWYSRAAVSVFVIGD